MARVAGEAHMVRFPGGLSWLSNTLGETCRADVSEECGVFNYNQARGRVVPVKLILLPEFPIKSNGQLSNCLVDKDRC